ncbi:hypothetical protein PCANC_04446 [Puccinia coronata f. sp. avenae]|uniref:Uncharacterized protein n=1 Tax=Puccinia coronata f. sp. avenae TaxID=200324 RepID=A0A2N5VUV4_9BASI|nr:hypothetical protein PCANC_04446 [Puccinia coronata f. sp. avenae]
MADGRFSKIEELKHWCFARRKACDAIIRGSGHHGRNVGEVTRRDSRMVPVMKTEPNTSSIALVHQNIYAEVVQRALGPMPWAKGGKGGLKVWISCTPRGGGSTAERTANIGPIRTWSSTIV